VSAARQLPADAALGIWAALSLVAAFYGTWLGLGGRPFAVTLAVFAMLLAGQILFAAGTIRERTTEALTVQFSAVALPFLPFLAYLIYAAGTNTFAWWRAGLCAGYVLAPALVVARGRHRRFGTWEDYAAVLLLWLPVEFHWLPHLWPYPNERLSHILTVLLAVNAAIVVFLLVRRLEGAGYTLAWGRGWGWTVGLNFLIFAAIAIPLGQATGFIRFDLSYERFQALPLAALGTFLFTAWPEELLFRGLLQNLVSRTFSSTLAGWLVASVIFGLAHLNNPPFPNWRYVLMATIAGLFYGRAWMKTGSIFASSLVHTLVNVFWHLLFR